MEVTQIYTRVGGTYMNTVRVGSRDSCLAVTQSKIVIETICAFDSEIDVQLITMKTTGDRILDRTLDKIGGKGLFVKELDAALLGGQVDITVHSSKDLPTDIDPGIPIVAVSRREDARDVLVLPEGVSELESGKPIGCSSARRAAQLKVIFPDARVRPVRGNILTRLSKLDKGEYSALVLAAAGLKRLGMESRVSRVFEVHEMLPAAGQGFLAVQARAGEDVSYLSKFHDSDAELCLMAERAFIKALDGGCSSPIAAHAVLDGEQMSVTGMDVTDGGKIIKSGISGVKHDAELLGAALAEKMRGER